jgi:hypothetical protein
VRTSINWNQSVFFSARPRAADRSAEASAAIERRSAKLTAPKINPTMV